MGRIRKPPKPRDALVPLSLAPDARGAPGSLDARTYAREEFTELELEVIRRLLEKQEPRSIGVDLGLAAQALDAMLAGPRFQREYELQTRLADRGVRARMERLTSEALDVVRDLADAHAPRAVARRHVLERLAAVMAKYPTLTAYVQGDPRGCALYILRPHDVPEGESADGYYSRGIAVYKE